MSLSPVPLTGKREAGEDRANDRDGGPLCAVGASKHV